MDGSADLDRIRVDGAELMQLGSWFHLIRRFFAVLAAGPLTDGEWGEVESWLDREEEVEIYRQQSVADQRHGWKAARQISAIRGDRRDLVRAALLHDVGKRGANLGVIERSLATLFAKLHLPVRGSWRRYLDHASLGADELARLGAGSMVVEFTRHHHGRRPFTIPLEEWDLLKSVD